MSSAAYLDEARLASRVLQKRERRAGYTAIQARNRVASSVGCAPGTIENLQRGRLKRLEAYVYNGLMARFQRAQEREIKALQHELDCLRLQGLSHDDPEFQEVQADYEAALAARTR